MSTDDALEPQLLRISQHADRLGVSPRVAYDWLAAGVIPPELVVRAGRAIYVKRRALDAWLAGRNKSEPPIS
jgi:excisionase family DNA binding protein